MSRLSTAVPRCTVELCSVLEEKKDTQSESTLRAEAETSAKQRALPRVLSFRSTNDRATSPFSTTWTLGHSQRHVTQGISHRASLSFSLFLCLYVPHPVHSRAECPDRVHSSLCFFFLLFPLNQWTMNNELSIRRNLLYLINARGLDSGSTGAISLTVTNVTTGQ